MNVVVAAHCGFCTGVRKAVETAMSVSAQNTYVLGELIHNEDVTARVRARGIPTVERLDEVPDGATLLIRSHGVGKEVYRICGGRNIAIVDCTCGFVRNAQRIVEKASAEGKTVAIAGHREHPEVVGLVGWGTGDVHVFASEEDDFSVLAGKNVVLLSQTTFSEQRFSKIAENIRKVYPKTVEIFKTICYTTVSRQKDAARLAKGSDAVLVIGGLNSSNTNKLAEIASQFCSRVYRLKNADDFEYEKVKFCKRVGIVAGASTPDWQTSEVLEKMAENNAEVQVETQVSEETATPVAEEPATAVPAEEAAQEQVVSEQETDSASAEQTEEVPAQAAPAEEKSAMDAIIAEMDKGAHYKRGQLLTVKIVSATDEGVYVSGSGKADILIDKSELDCDEYSREAYAAKIGENIDVMVVDAKAPVKLSEKQVRKVKEEEALLKDIEEGKEFSVVCTGFNKGGLTAELGTYAVFVPAREIRSGYVKELDKMVGKKLRLKMLEIRRERRKEIIASQRVILEAEKAAREAAKAEREAAFFDSIQVGDVVEGKVERVTSFGAFVSVNGFDCLAHISDLSWTGVKEVTDVLEIGKRYQFKVLKIDKENKKVSIGYKQLQPRPWDTAAERYAQGDIVHGKVVRIVPFGAFVELEKGIDGLVHVSQITHEWLENPTSALTIGQEIDAKVLAFDPEEHKITLSIKALQPRPWDDRDNARDSRDRDEEVERRPRQRGKGNRRTASDYADEAEYREWSEGGYGGASIADLLGNDDNK